MFSKRIVLRAFPSNPTSLVTWSVTDGENILVANNLEVGPTGPLLIIKKNVLVPGQEVTLEATATR